MSMEPFPISTAAQTENDCARQQAYSRYGRPADVLADRLLTVEERRTILSFWASDACAVESAPTLRQLPDTPGPVLFEEVKRALLELDQVVGLHRAQTRVRPSRWPAIAA